MTAAGYSSVLSQPKRLKSELKVTRNNKYTEFSLSILGMFSFPLNVSWNNINMQVWRLIKDGYNDGSYNMVVDEAIASAVEEGISPPTLRFYGWKSPTLSIGYSQRLENKIDAEYCRKNEIDIVLRPTGGKAVLHDKEVTYSLISPKNNPLFPDNISGTYEVIGKALLKGLSFLKIEAILSTPNSLTPHLNPLPSEERDDFYSELQTPNSKLKNLSCFATTSQYEIIADGKKLIGSAQRRFKNSFLQHGSIPLENHHQKLSQCLGFKEGYKGKKFVNLLKEKSIALNELNGRVYSYNEVVEALARGFEDAFKLVPEGSNQGIQFKISSLSEYELALSNRLYEKKKII